MAEVLTVEGECTVKETKSKKTDKPGRIVTVEDITIWEWNPQRFAILDRHDRKWVKLEYDKNEKTGYNEFDDIKEIPRPIGARTKDQSIEQQVCIYSAKDIVVALLAASVITTLVDTRVAYRELINDGAKAFSEAMPDESPTETPEPAEKQASEPSGGKKPTKADFDAFGKYLVNQGIDKEKCRELLSKVAERPVKDVKDWLTEYTLADAYTAIQSMMAVDGLDDEIPPF